MRPEEPRAYLSRSGGLWRLIYNGSPLCADGDEAAARACARRYRVDLSHGLTWDGDAAMWSREDASGAAS